MNRKQKQINRAFLNATVSSDTKQIERLLEEGADPTAREPEHNQPAITLAAIFADKEIVELLLANGAEIDARDDSGRTALFFTAVGSDKFNTLIASGANIHAVDHEGNTILMNAVAKSASAADVERLLTLGVARDVKNADGESALDIADQLGLVKVVDLLK